MKNLILVSLLAVILSSCSSPRVISPAPVNAHLNPLPVAIAPNDKVVIVSENLDLLRLKFQTFGTEQDFADNLRLHVQGNINSRDAQIVLNGSHDLNLIIAPNFSLIDKQGNYYRMNCEINVQLLPANGHQLYATKNFSLKSGERKFGEKEAKEQFLASAGSQIADWIRTQLNVIARDKINATIMRFALGEPLVQIDRNLQTKQILNIGEIIGELDGVVAYQLVEQDFVQNLCSYRIVYFKHNFPSGLSNVIANRLPQYNK